MRIAWTIFKIVLFMLLFVVWTMACILGAAYLFLWAVHVLPFK